jgi:aryl-alcohol dehydrogenase-like predicted oxidoreductase
MPTLPKRKLGRTGLDVTVLGFGAMELRGPNAGVRGGRQLAPGQAERVLNIALDSGINFIDTSIDYGDSEELIGRHIAHRRREYILASKCGCIVDPVSAPPGVRHLYTKKNVLDGVHQSLRRMRTDYLDLVQFHNAASRKDVEAEGALEALMQLKREGKVRFIGSSSVLPGLAELIGMGVFDAFQIPYSAVDREHEQAITRAARAGAGTVIRGGVARGEPGRGLADANRWQVWDRAKLDDLLGGMTRMQFLLRFTVSHPDLHTTIVGTINPDHLADNVKAAMQGPLPSDVYTEAKRRLATAGAVPVQA